MKTKVEAVRGVVFNWMGRGCAILIAFFVTPILMRTLGNEAYGIWAIVMNLTSYYNMADLGMRGATVKYIAEHKARQDHDKVNQVLSTCVVIYTALALLGFLVAAAAAFVFPAIFGTGPYSAWEIRCVVLLTGANVAVGLCGTPFDGVLTAMKRFDLANLLAVGTQIVQAISIISVVRSGWGLIGMACATLAVGAASQLIQCLLAIRTIAPVSLAPRYFRRNELRALFGFGILNALHDAARRTTESSGNLVVGAFLGPSAVAFYNPAESVVQKTTGFGKGVTGVMMPIASQLEAQQRWGELHDFFIVVTRNLLAIALLLTTLFVAFGYPLISLWIGPEYAPQAYPVLCLLAIARVMRMPSNCARSILQGMAQLRFLVVLAIVDVVITLGLGSLLVIPFGLIGMACATLASQVLTAGAAIPIYACRLLQVDIRHYTLQSTVPGTLAVVPGAVLAFTLATYFSINDLSDLILQGSAVAGTGAISIYLLCFNRSQRRSLACSFLPTRQAKAQETARALEPAQK